MTFKIYKNQYISTVLNSGTGTKIGNQQGSTITLKTLKAGPNISITDNTTEIVISASATSTTTLSDNSLSIGETIITNGIGPDLTVKGFVGASGIVVYTDNNNDIVISGSGIVGAVTTLSNDPLSVGESIITNGIGPNLTVKGFVGASGISIYTDSNNDIAISGSGVITEIINRITPGGGIKGTVTTTSFPYVTLIPIATTTNTSYILDVIIVGSNMTNNNTNLFFIKGGYKNVGGTLTKISSFDDKMIEKEDSSTNARLSISGTNIIVEVKGITANTINWTGEARIQIAYF